MDKKIRRAIKNVLIAMERKYKMLLTGSLTYDCSTYSTNIFWLLSEYWTKLFSILICPFRWSQLSQDVFTSWIMSCGWVGGGKDSKLKIRKIRKLIPLFFRPQMEIFAFIGKSLLFFLAGIPVFVNFGFYFCNKITIEATICFEPDIQKISVILKGTLINSLKNLKSKATI